MKPDRLALEPISLTNQYGIGHRRDTYRIPNTPVGNKLTGKKKQTNMNVNKPSQGYFENSFAEYHLVINAYETLTKHSPEVKP